MGRVTDQSLKGVHSVYNVISYGRGRVRRRREVEEEEEAKVNFAFLAIINLNRFLTAFNRLLEKINWK